MSWLSNPRKTRVFSFIRQMWQIFKSFSFPSLRLSRTPFNPKPFFTQTSSFSSKNLCKITSRYVFLNIFFMFSKIMQKFKLGFKNWGFSKIGLGFLVFVKFFWNLWLGWIPFVVIVLLLAPCGSLWGIFHNVLAFFIICVLCCMLGVWQNVLVTFLC